MKKNSGDSEWASFLEKISNARKAIGCPEDGRTEAWFRGHANSSHSLLPSLFRAFEDRNPGQGWQRIWNTESDLFWEFYARARELYDSIQDDWDILFAMQHYGTPTRLLDWTEVLGIALYFAVLGVDEFREKDELGNQVPPPCIWVLNPFKLNEIAGRWSFREREADIVFPKFLGWKQNEGRYDGYGELLQGNNIGWESPTAIYPRQLNPRIHAQRGWFTIHGDCFEPIESIEGHENYLRKVDLPFAAVPAARRFLDLAGLDHYALFADLQSLSLHLKEKNGLLTREQASGQARAVIESRRMIPSHVRDHRPPDK